MPNRIGTGSVSFSIAAGRRPDRDTRGSPSDRAPGRCRCGRPCGRRRSPAPARPPGGRPCPPAALPAPRPGRRRRVPTDRAAAQKPPRAGPSRRPWPNRHRRGPPSRPAAAPPARRRRPAAGRRSHPVARPRSRSARGLPQSRPGRRRPARRPAGAPPHDRRHRRGEVPQRQPPGPHRGGILAGRPVDRGESGREIGVGPRALHADPDPLGRPLRRVPREHQKAASPICRPPPGSRTTGAGSTGSGSASPSVNVTPATYSSRSVRTLAGAGSVTACGPCPVWKTPATTGPAASSR